MRAGLTTRLLAATAVLAVIISAAFVYLLFAMTAVNRAMDDATHSAQEAFVTRDIRRALGDMETSERGFIITKDASFLAPWEAGRERLPERLATLRQLVDEPGQAMRAEQLQKDASSYLSQYSVPVVDAAQRGESWVTSPAVSDDGKRRMDSLRRQIETYLSTEAALSASAQTDAAVLYRRATMAAGVGIALSVLVIALGSAYLARTVLRPVRRTAQMAERLAAGDLDARVPQRGTAEIGVLARNFNSMAESLQHHRDELARLNKEQAALRHVATLVAEGRPANEIFSAVTEEVGLLIHADITRLLRFEADGSGTIAAAWTRTHDPMPVGARINIESTVAAHVRQSGNPARHTEVSPPDLPDATYSAVGAPIMVGGAAWGAITGLSPIDRGLPDDTENRMAEFTHLVGTAIANAQARHDLMASRARLVAAADDARRRIERNLHDGIQQRLVTLALGLRSAEAEVPAETAELRESWWDSTVNSVRRWTTCARYRAASIRRSSPRAASPRRWAPCPAARSCWWRPEIHIDGRLPSTVEAAAYYVAAECLTNIAKHADASVVTLDAAVRDDHLFLTVHDDGAGGADPSQGSGLIGLIDRVEALGGTLRFASPRGNGTTVRIDLPLGGQGPPDADPIPAL